MRLPFNGTFTLTQHFNDPCCRASYAQFGLKGHNGLDYGLPVGTPVVAPVSGTVLEVADEGKKGFGRYLKIESNKEGSVLAHLDAFTVKVGTKVKEGDLVGYSGNTGNSTGPHLHWGYYTLPRDRNNGFNGYIDQEPMLSSATSTNPSNNDCEKKISKLQKEVDSVTKEKEKYKTEARKLREDIKSKDKTIEDLNKEIATLKLAVDKFESNWNTEKEISKTASIEAKANLDNYTRARELAGGLQSSIIELQDKIKALKSNKMAVPEAVSVLATSVSDWASRMIEKLYGDTKKTS